MSELSGVMVTFYILKYIGVCICLNSESVHLRFSHCIAFYSQKKKKPEHILKSC